MFADVIATSREITASDLFEPDSLETPSTSRPSSASQSSDSPPPRTLTINIPGAIPTTSHVPQSQESPSLPSLPSDATVIQNAEEAKQQTGGARSLDDLENWATPANRNWSPPFPLKPPLQKRDLRYGRPVAKLLPAKSLLDGSFYGKALLPIGVCVGEYLIIRLLSEQGGNGLVVLAAHRYTGNVYAMKIGRYENAMRREARVHSKITQRLKDVEELLIPRLHAVYKECTKDIMVMDVLGPSLEDLWRAVGNPTDRTLYPYYHATPLCTKTCVQLALGLLATYEQLHSVGYVHLTTKPENFCIGRTKETQGRIYAIDFGRVRSFLQKDGSHAGEYRLPQQVLDLYASIWNEGKRAASRRDDLMSITLMVIHMALGKTPWERNKEKKGKKAKEFTKKDWVEIVVKGHRSRKLWPFEEMIAYIGGLAYTDVPDYQLLREILHTYAKKKGILLDGAYEWDHLLQINEEGFISLRNVGKGRSFRSRSCSR